MAFSEKNTILRVICRFKALVHVQRNKSIAKPKQILFEQLLRRTNVRRARMS